MKFIATTKDLAANLAIAAKAVSSRPTHPILANILVEANTKLNQVTLTGFDLTMAITTHFTAEVSEGGSTTVPARLLTDIVSKMSEIGRAHV